MPYTPVCRIKNGRPCCNVLRVEGVFATHEYIVPSHIHMDERVKVMLEWKGVHQC